MKFLISLGTNLFFTRNDKVEGKENPGKVHCLELSPKPEVDNGVLVELAPHIEDAHDHGVHQDLDVHEESHDGGQHPVEEQHEEIVRRPAIKDSRLQPQTVVVQEVEVDEEMESCLRGEGIIEQGSDWSPNVKPK